MVHIYGHLLFSTWNEIIFSGDAGGAVANARQREELHLHLSEGAAPNQLQVGRQSVEDQYPGKF